MSAEEIIVIGGGFAGVTAARNLSQLGYRVRLLEARDRLGGRTHVRRFLDTERHIETGGAWFSGEIERFAHREVTRYGLNYKPDPEAETYGHLLGGKRHESALPIAMDELVDFERVAVHFIKSAQIFDPSVPVDLQPGKSFDITWDEFIDPLGLPTQVRDLVDVWGLQTTGGLGSENASVITHLWTTAFYNHSLVWWATMLEKQLEGGTRALINAIIGDSNVTVQFETTVTRVQHDDARVQVETSDGTVLTASGVVVAVPVNLWADIEFSPALCEDKIIGAGMRPETRGAKAWALVEGAPPGFAGFGTVEAGRGVTVITSQGEIDGARLLFLLSPVGKREGFDVQFDPCDRQQVDDVIQAYLPGARLIAHDAEDWNVEPYSRGAWGAYRIGQMEHLAGMRRPEGRLVFAGADIARGTLGIDGAIESGTYAAATLDRIITEGA
jgi:monoamine oxidase